MRKILFLGLLLSVFCVFSSHSVNAKTESIFVGAEPSFKKVVINWVWNKNRDEAKYYKVYRKCASDKKFKYLKKTKGLKFTDKKIKKNKKYIYKIIGFDKKGKVKYKGSAKAAIMLETPYLSTTDYDGFLISNRQKNTVTLSKEYVAPGKYEKVLTDKVELYRKKKGDKKFKKIKNIKIRYDLISDTSVKAKSYYVYKVRNYYKIGKKKVYSKYSNTLKVWATRGYGEYKAEKVKVYEENGLKTMILKISNIDNYNGILYSNNDTMNYMLYGYDGKTWNNLNNDVCLLDENKNEVFLKIYVNNRIPEYTSFDYQSEDEGAFSVNYIGFDKSEKRLCYFHYDLKKNIATLGSMEES